MSDDAERPRQVSVAELLAQYGGAEQSAPSSRRRRAAIAETPPAPEPPTEQAEPTREVDPPVGETDPRPVEAEPVVTEEVSHPEAMTGDAQRDSDTGPRNVGVAVLLVELVAAAAVGAALWLGFRWMWGQWPVVALVLAVLVSVGSVVVVRLVHRVEDVLSMLLALVVGLVVTMSPAALALVGA